MNIADYEQKVRDAVQTFWRTREQAQQRQLESGDVDRGERGGVTSGKNMDGFIDLFEGIVRDNGLIHAEIHRQQRLLALPGYFRPTKLWDLLVIHEGRLIAALELKSHIGPSFGNNFNNRTEEVIGSGHDLWTAYREGSLGDGPPPFAGWMLLLEDSDGSRAPVQTTSPHFPVSEEFENASYAQRYDILCRKLMQEQLYSTASLIMSPRSALDTGDYSQMSDTTRLQTLVSRLAGHITAEAAMG